MISHLWNQWFLTERPSISLCVFRMAVAITTGFHVIPTFFHMDDNFYHTAFKELNGYFFTNKALELVQKSPDGLVTIMAVIFCMSFVSFFIGFRSQISCIVLMICCYFFYALNAFFIGTLSWDILLVTLFLMCVVPYHGDYFSVDCLLKANDHAYKTPRPFFLQRLLQLQIASTFFYTALYKVTVDGNWIKDNPVYYLMSGPATGVAKHFLFKEWMVASPNFCYFIGLFVVAMELFLPFLLFYSKTRRSAIYLGVFFHLLLILTLDVPAIFFFLFPAQLLLFINPEKIVKWIDQRREYHQVRPRPKLLYDGQCGFCLGSVQALKVMDLVSRVEFIDFRTLPDLSHIHPRLNAAVAASQIHLVESPEGERIYCGFYAFRRMSLLMPMLYPIALILYFPGVGIWGPVMYSGIARNRYFLHRNKICNNNACFLR
ncbi:MAG: DUF393 domain-containing protein [Candidatus Omnitrophica bacterium]|nr:DUF393 domain-containing protein [Candidatus Omnitrophota bacterium]